jgi:hypothetical protein
MKYWTLIIIATLTIMACSQKKSDEWVGNVIVIEGQHYIYTPRQTFERISPEYIEYSVNQYKIEGVYGNGSR